VRIDLNADVGESFGPWSMGDDARLIPLVTSVNIACGFHAGDPLTIERTVARAVAARVTIGAHPGYPDLAGFGRRDMDMPAAELEAAIVYQVSAVAGFTRAAGTELRHVKPHGALYNRAARDPALAEIVARAVRRCSSELLLVGLAGSNLLVAGQAAGLEVVREGFADRAYEADGRLRSRSEPDAMLDPDAAAKQAVSLVQQNIATAIDGSPVAIEPETLCIHGDSADAVKTALAVRAALEDAGIEILPVGR
jgi:UPF0271 protein